MKKKSLWIAKDDRSYKLYNRAPTKRDIYTGLSNSFIWKNELRILCCPVVEKCTNIKLKSGQYTKIEVKQIGEVWELIE